MSRPPSLHGRRRRGGPWSATLAALIVGCAARDPLPPLPKDPGRWEAAAEELSWEGRLAGDLPARMSSAHATVQLAGDGLDALEGRFFELRLGFGPVDAPIAVLQADEGEGRWPSGPLDLRGVRWQLLSTGQRGDLERARWRRDGRWSCGGCPLEQLLATVQIEADQ